MPLPTRLIEGYRAFLGGRLRGEQDRYRELAESGQSPQVMVIGCCDSRVSPEVIFDARPGELFVVRNVANLVPPYAPDGQAHGVSAALEYGVQVLKVPHVVVLGHAGCGGIRAFIENNAPPSPGDFIGTWMSLIAPVARAIGPRRDDEPHHVYVDRLEKAAVLLSISNLLSFPYVKALTEDKTLTLHAAFFGVAEGRLMVHDKDAGRFVPVAADEYARVFAQPRF